MRRGVIVMARKTGHATIVPLFKQKVVLAIEASSNVQAERDFIDESVHRWRGATGDAFCVRCNEDGVYPGTLIVRSFRKCSISNAPNGTKYSALFEDDSDKEDSGQASSDDIE